MYLRETRRRNRDGSEVSYLALAHNERDPDTGMPKAHIVDNFGRADLVDRDGLARLIKSISRFLDPADAVAATWVRDRVFIPGLDTVSDDACYRAMDTSWRCSTPATTPSSPPIAARIRSAGRWIARVMPSPCWRARVALPLISLRVRVRRRSPRLPSPW